MQLMGIMVFSAALLFSFGEMGFLTEALNRLASFTLASVFVIIERPRSLSKVTRPRWLAGILLLVLAAVLGQGHELWRGMAFIALVAALLVTTDEEDPGHRDLVFLIPAVVFFLVFHLAHLHLTHLWWLTSRTAIGFSGAVGKMIGENYAMSFTMSGFWMGIFAACWGLSRLIWAKGRRPWDFGVFLLFIIATNALVLMLLTPIAVGIQRWAPSLDFLLFNPQTIHLLALLCPIAWYRRRTSGGAVGSPMAFQPAALALALLAGVVLAAGLTLMPKPGSGGGKVVILDEGYLNWDVPVFGRYGERSGGMFGRLPGFLEAQGFEVVKGPEALTAEVLADARVLVMINQMEFFNTREKAVIWDFVARGGSLLALGDHTGVKGIRGPFNDLLKPVNIGFEFDSGTFWAQGWRDALELLPHPINRDVIVSEDIQIWVGASLGFAPPAKPVIIGKYGFSDVGDAANLERSYLGDRLYNPGEQLGDICLVAEASYGKGRVLVFGDTSPFQNGALVTAWPFVQRVFQWLTSPPDNNRFPFRELLIIVAVALILLSRRSLSRSVHAWSVLGLGIVLGTMVTGHLAEPPPVPRIDLRKAVIDLSHVGRFDQLTWYDDCVGGLELNLARNGYCSMMMRKFSGSLVMDSELLVVIAPAKPFRGKELETVRAFVESGGVLILSTGYEERDRSEPLLAMFGAAIQNVPLAHFDIALYGQSVHVSEAWPLKLSRADAVGIGYHPGHPDPFMAFVPEGGAGGGALIIADSQFLLNSNLEALEEWKVGNIMFLKEFFERLNAGELR
ncbi:MAG: hypothetical protein KAW17_12970 [Candidatus Eisenbacteria sp.]|nr:hypothetical protein [Candidatus Eisenbacteria bacterium]